MVSLVALSVPILAAAVLVFIASAIVNTVLPWHKGDYPGIAREDEFRTAVRPLGLPPGDYMVPRAGSMKEYGTEEFRAKLREGPNMMLTVMPNEAAGMGRPLVLWFIYLLVIAQFGAYIASRTLPAGTDYMQVFRVVGATTFVGLAGGLWQMSIWYRRSWVTTVKATIDALAYALLMAGVFGWMWP